MSLHRPPLCEFCGRRPLSPGGNRLREHLLAIWAAPTAKAFEEPLEAERAKAKAEVAAALASMPLDGPGLVKGE